MSTTHIQPLPNVYGRMAYTELGEGKKRTENIQNGTNRIAAQMGDGDSREEFVRFCSAMKRQNQGRENEGFEVRVSWAPEELSKDNPEDIQRACEYGYLLCKEVAPNAPCWVTVHTDGEREEQAKRIRLQEREDKAARRAGGRVKYGADADKQYE